MNGTRRNCSLVKSDVRNNEDEHRVLQQRSDDRVRPQRQHRPRTEKDVTSQLTVTVRQSRDSNSCSPANTGEEKNHRCDTENSTKLIDVMLKKQYKTHLCDLRKQSKTHEWNH